MEPDETVLAFGEEERQCRNPAESVRQGGGDVFVEAE
jgi:hypothetical protein